ncbi:hypothetical protein ACCO45_000383 [Purpureocillium lilacinum]|uniref:Uncharacterized protein n=1 Tax=Purpureocillium lilacinum TaxID=33203 RepID=A0ACC4E418_PURLI
MALDAAAPLRRRLNHLVLPRRLGQPFQDEEVKHDINLEPRLNGANVDTFHQVRSSVDVRRRIDATCWPMSGKAAEYNDIVLAPSLTRVVEPAAWYNKRETTIVYGVSGDLAGEKRPAMPTTTITVANVTYTLPDITTSTNLGLLPTTSFPSNCLNDLYDMRTTGLGLPWNYNTLGCALSSCCPSSRPFTSPWGWMTSYYSPGVCPSGYRTCSPPMAPTQLSSEPGETIAFCCPGGFECPQGTSGLSLFQACGSLLATPTAITVLNNMFDQSIVTTTTWPVSVVPNGWWQIAYPIQIRWKEGDDFSPKSSSLSAGAIAGIVIGSVLAAIIAAVSGFLLWRKRRRRKSASLSNGGLKLCPAAPQELATAGYSNGSNGQKSWDRRPSELGSVNYGAGPPMELVGQEYRANETDVRY